MLKRMGHLTGWRGGFLKGLSWQRNRWRAGRGAPRSSRGRPFAPFVSGENGGNTQPPPRPPRREAFLRRCPLAPDTRFYAGVARHARPLLLGRPRLRRPGTLQPQPARPRRVSCSLGVFRKRGRAFGCRTLIGETPFLGG